ncbi:hypothetical protein [Chitinophaga sp. Ak27]|uniref:hypothetical protein n=1 Tax=Chitinophaga sp. Ak27 TaxID=2726116 RepID=UPI00145D14AD|nr:hypothetical protein [Chitinophaga sp. Ak27]NLU90932.1 hypothetical protein [Chitinophaga sp. Ak27]
MRLKLLRSITGTGLATILLSMNIACKKSKDNNDTPITPRTNITTDIAGDSWFGLDEVNMDNELHYTLTVYNPTTGIWFNNAPDPWDMVPRPGNGIRFSANGDFEICRFTNSGMGGLKSYAFFYMKGTAEQKGNDITLHPTVYRNTYKSVSDPSLDYDKDLPRNATKIKYATNRYTNGWDHVDITWEDNTVSRYYRRY